MPAMQDELQVRCVTKLYVFPWVLFREGIACIYNYCTKDLDGTK